jgi:rhodanese-related sulfurtransferase
MKALTAQGPEKGGYHLVDSRPATAYMEGHIPGAVNIPFPALQKQKEAVLPADKNTQVIFYCGGFV